MNRLLFALINEGARILDDAPAISAPDIDAVYVAGYGFPSSRGGPMYYADSIGIGSILAAMERFAGQEGGDSSFWKPARSLKHAAALRERLTLSALNG